MLKRLGRGLAAVRRGGHLAAVRLRRPLARQRAAAAASPASGACACGAVEVAACLEAARRSFLCVQQAWDRADLDALARVTSEPLLEELRSQLAERGPAPNHTEVVRLEARLLGMEQVHDAQVASIEFSGLIREGHDRPPAPFRELWMLARLPVRATPPADTRSNPAQDTAHGPAGGSGADPGADPGSNWRVARVQALG